MKKDKENFTKLSSERRKFLKKLLKGTMLTTAAIMTVQLKTYAAQNRNITAATSFGTSVSTDSNVPR